MFGVIRHPDRYPADHHVSITYGLHFVHVIRVYGGVEAGVEIVEQIDDLKRGRMGGDGREADDIGEVDGHLFELFGIDGHSQLQFFGHRTAIKKEINVISDYVFMLGKF